MHELVRADPALALKTALRDSMPVLIDEWQRAPEIWDEVRRAVDADRTGGQYLLTGSASPDKPNTHSGAGRIASLRMRPMALCERDVDVPTVSLSKLLHSRRRTLRGSTDVTIVDYTREILASGFPGLRELTGRARRVQRDGHLKRIVDHGVIRNNLRRGDGRRARKAGQDHEYCVSRSARASVDRRCRAGMVACAEYDVPAASATIPTMAAQNGNSTAPATPAVNGMPISVRAAPFRTTMRRTLPSRTSALLAEHLIGIDRKDHRAHRPAP